MGRGLNSSTPIKRKDMDNRTLIDKVSTSSGVRREDVQAIIEGLCSLVAERCVDMDTVVVPGFGQFEAKKRKERLTVHPASGMRLMVPPKLVLGFKPSGVLKSKIGNV